MVWKSAEAVGKLPVSNKQSFRRDWMECIGEIAETVREFEGYVSTSLTSDTGNDTIDEEKDEDDEDDDDDEFNEEVRYSMDEIPLVQKALTLMTHSLATTKLGLQVLTVIGDALNKIISVDNIDLEVALRSLSIQSTDSEGKSPTVDSISGVCTSASEGIYTSSGSLIERLTADRSGLMVWIGEMVRVRKHLLDALTDLGCELYTPIDAVDVNKLYIVTLHYSKLLLGLLMHPPFQSFLSEEVKTKLTETNVQLHAVST